MTETAVQTASIVLSADERDPMPIFVAGEANPRFAKPGEPIKLPVEAAAHLVHRDERFSLAEGQDELPEPEEPPVDAPPAEPTEPENPPVDAPPAEPKAAAADPEPTPEPASQPEPPEQQASDSPEPRRRRS